MLDGDAVFVPGDIPRHGGFAFWGAGPGPDKVELVFDAGTYGVRKRQVTSTFVPVAEVLPELVAVDPAAQGVRRSLAVWAAAATVGVGLVARGRLLPTVTADGADAWRAGPLDAADLTWLRELAACFPATAHALAIPGSRPMRLRSPESLIRELWDAIADTLVRTAAAPSAVSSPAFAAAGRSDVTDLAEWLSDTADGLSAGARLGLRVEPASSLPPGYLDEPDAFGDMDQYDEPALPDDDLDSGPGDAGDGEAGDGEADGPRFRMVLQLRSTAEETLIVDAADLWDQPERVLTRFGPQAETDLLLAMRQGAAIWPPLTQVLEQPRPTAISLGDSDLSDLLGSVAEDLASAGIEVLWPSSLVGDGLTLQAVVSAPGKVTEAGFSLEALLEFRWQLTLGGELLDPDEINEIAEAKRPLIRLRGRWVTLDPGLLERLRRPPRARMRAMEAVGAVLAGSAEIDGETVTVVAEGVIADLAERLAGLAAAPPALPPPPGLEATLRPYQLRGLSWLAAMCDAGLGGCLADDMGLGKTIQVIALHLHRRPAGAGPTLVVCPASLLGNWEREIHRFAPGIPVRRYHGGGRHLRDVAPDEVVLVTYGVVLPRHGRAGAAWTGAWLSPTRPSTSRTRCPGPRGSCGRCQRPRRLALTGTPVENRLSELWSILDWTTPGLLGPLETFIRRIAVPVERHRDPEATARLSRAGAAVPAAAPQI